MAGGNAYLLLPGQKTENRHRAMGRDGPGNQLLVPGRADPIADNAGEADSRIKLSESLDHGGDTFSRRADINHQEHR